MRTPPPEGNRVAFIDGENLVMRYQAMVQAGAVPNEGIAYIRDQFVWAPRQLTTFNSISRASYYTSVIGDEVALDTAVDNIQCHYVEGYNGATRRLDAKVFKKSKRNDKSRHVDIYITLDSLRAAYRHDVQDIVFVTGDGDFLPVIQEIMRTGIRVHIASLSSGLSPALTRVGDSYEDWDHRFFKSLPPTQIGNG